MLLFSGIVLSMLCTSLSGARISMAKLTHLDTSEDLRKAPASDTSTVCSEFKARSVVQQCSGVRSLDVLGFYDDQVACGEACKGAAEAARQSTCCVFTQLDKCVAYVGSQHILDGHVSADATSGRISYRGSATVCRQISRIGGRVNESAEQWEFAKAAAPGTVKKFLSLFGDVGADQIEMIPGHGEALFRKIKPREIKQGSLGDCWLMAVIAAMARFPGAIRKLFLQQFRSAKGEYNVRLYNPVQSKWTWVSIDDSLPSALFQDPKYAQLAADRTVWVLLLEKAVAKLVDPQGEFDGMDRSKGYSKLIAGFTEFAMTLLSGAQNLDLWKRKTDPLVIMKAAEVNVTQFSLQNAFPSANFRHGTIKETERKNNSWMAWLSGDGLIRSREFKYYTIDDAWAAFISGTKLNRLMAGAISKTSSTSGETEEGDGLYGGHAYSILQAKEITLSSQACVETISVTYASMKDWTQDAGFMKRVWWGSGAHKKRFTGASWTTSRAARHGVEEGWSLVDPTAFDGPGPTDVAVRRVAFNGVVDDFACDTYERHRSGRQTKLVRMPMTTLKSGESVRLLQIRNPWGNEEKWTGAWSDTDITQWAKHPDIAEVVGFAPLADGMWWMALEDFLIRFSRWSIGDVDMLSFSPSVSNGDCADGFLGKFAWNGSIAVAEGSCTPAPCNIIGTTGDGPNCKCVPGLSGEIRWKGPVASGECLVDASNLFNEGSERLWAHNGMEIKCCESDGGLQTRLQDLNARNLPSSRRAGMQVFIDPKGCGGMFGETYHNSMKKKHPKCNVAVTLLMEASGESFETIQEMLRM